MLEACPWFDDLRACVRQILERAEKQSMSSPPDKDIRRRMRRMRGGWQIYAEETLNYSSLIRAGSEEMSNSPEGKSLSSAMAADGHVLEYFRGRMSGKRGEKLIPTPELINTKVWGAIPRQIAHRYAEFTSGLAWDDNMFLETFRDWEPHGFTGKATASCIAPLWNFDIADSLDAYVLAPFKLRKVTDDDADILCHAGFSTMRLLSGPLSFPEVTVEYPFMHEKPTSSGIPPKGVRWLHALLRSIRTFTTGCPSIEAVFETPRKGTYGFTSCAGFPEMQGKSSLLTRPAKLKAGELGQLRKYWEFLVSSYGEALRSLPGELNRAMSRFGMASKETIEEERLIDLVIALDALLMKEGEHDGRILSRRGAVLIGSSSQDISMQRKLLEVAYQKRSAVVHGEAMKKIVLGDQEIPVHKFNAKVEGACRQVLQRMLVLGVGKPDLRAVIERIQRATKDNALQKRIREESTPPWTT